MQGYVAPLSLTRCQLLPVAWVQMYKMQFGQTIAKSPQEIVKDPPELKGCRCRSPKPS